MVRACCYKGSGKFYTRRESVKFLGLIVIQKFWGGGLQELKISKGLSDA